MNIYKFPLVITVTSPQSYWCDCGEHYDLLKDRSSLYQGKWLTLSGKIDKGSYWLWPYGFMVIKV